MAYLETDGAVNLAGGNGGFMNGDSPFWAIILLAIIFGWNRGGSGFGGSGVNDNYVLATDFATLERKLDGVNNGICDSTYALNNTIVNGNASIQQTLTQGFSGLNLGLATQGCDTRAVITGVGTQIASQIADLKYSNAMNARDIIDNANANFRALHEEIVANRIEDKNAQIAAQQNEINALRLSASQAKQNEYLVNQLRPCPIPAYLTCNPYATTSCGCSAVQ